jgi:hypothetical protein
MARVHRLVAEAFLPNPGALPCVNHIDCNRSNNDVGNLEWCTQQQNLEHAGRLGRMQRNYWVGKRSPNASLGNGVADIIRARYQAGGASWASLSKEFGISKRSVGRIIRREHYLPLPKPLEPQP